MHPRAALKDFIARLLTLYSRFGLTTTRLYAQFTKMKPFSCPFYFGDAGAPGVARTRLDYRTGKLATANWECGFSDSILGGAQGYEKSQHRGRMK